MATSQFLEEPDPEDDMIVCPECYRTSYDCLTDTCRTCGFAPETVADLLTDHERAEAEKAWDRLSEDVALYILNHPPKEGAA